MQKKTEAIWGIYIPVKFRSIINSINKINREPIHAGAYGNYYYICKGLCCKLMHDYGWGNLYKEAKKEIKLLMIAQKSGITPKFYCLKYIKHNGKKLPAIFMENITGVCRSEFGMYMENDYGMDKKSFRMVKRAENKLKKISGLIHDDVHSGNVRFVKKYGRTIIKFIDFTPCCISKV